MATNSFQVGVESYGLKSLEALAEYQRHGDIEGGAGAVVDYDRYMDSRRSCPPRGDRPLQRGRRPGHPGAPRLASGSSPTRCRVAGAGARRSTRDDPELDLLAEQLLASDPGTPEHLLGDLLGYWRRERSADVGPKFAKLESDTHELLDDPDVVAELSFVGFEEHQGQKGDLTYAVFSWPDQPLANDLDKRSRSHRRRPRRERIRRTGRHRPGPAHAHAALEREAGGGRLLSPGPQPG